MEHLTIKNQTIGLHFNPQVGTNNKPFRYCGIRKNEDYPEKWIDKVLKWHWIYTFVYINNNEVFELEFDYNDKFLKKL